MMVLPTKRGTFSSALAKTVCKELLSEMDHKRAFARIFFHSQPIQRLTQIIMLSAIRMMFGTLTSFAAL